MRHLVAVWLLVAFASALPAQTRPAVHLWFEPEWFDGIKGSFAYWTGSAQATGSWGIAGPGISAEWSQGGESEWNSMGAAAAETSARCQRDFVVPRTGAYKVWVRYVDHRKKTEPFRVIIEQAGKTVLSGELGVLPVVPANDEYQLFWGFSFGWGALDAKLDEGPARLILAIEKAGEGWRQVDAVLITEDVGFVPNGREKPRFAYQSSFDIHPPKGTSWRGTQKTFAVQPDRRRPAMGGRDFSMWTGIDPDPKWWGKQDLDKLSLYDVYFQFSPPSDIRDQFHKQLALRKDIPLLSWPHLLPGFHLGPSPNLSDGTPLRKWFERTKTPFYIMTNYASGNYNDKNGPGTYAALTGPLAGQFLGYIHGEAIGTSGLAFPEKSLANDRRGHVDALPKYLREKQAEAWSRIYKTKVAEEHWDKGIPCLSVDSIALAHLFHGSGARTVGYEIDSTNVHVPMRIAFERGAARQYGGAWINYASGNFGDACNYFTQQPIVPRGAPSWFHSKYSVTDGVSISWYRKLYYLNYLGGASAIYWEQSLQNQWMVPGPGKHPVQLSPFGRATEDFQSFVGRLSDRGEPYTPVGILLSYGHGYESVSYRCKMLHVFDQDQNDRELRELFNVCWHPSAILEGLPASPDVQSMPSGVYGDIFDVIVDRPSKASAMLQYPVVWAAGDARLGGDMLPAVKTYLAQGGTLVANITTAKDLPSELTGLQPTGKVVKASEWSVGPETRVATPFQLVEATLKGAEPLAFAAGKQPLITRHSVGAGAVIIVLVPHGLGLDERAHPCLPVLMNALTEDLLPIEVCLGNGERPKGEVMYQVNKTKDGYLVSLYNHHGIDKTQNGIARVDRKAFVDVVVRTKLKVQAVREMTEPRDLNTVQQGEKTEIRLRLPPGDVQVLSLRLK